MQRRFEFSTRYPQQNFVNEKLIFGPLSGLFRQVTSLNLKVFEKKILLGLTVGESGIE